MPLSPSRKDVTGPPPRNVSDLASIVRHHGSYLRSLDPGFLEGRFATPSLVRVRPSQLVGGDDAAGGEDNVLGKSGDRLVLTSLATQVWNLSYVPVFETIVVRWHPDACAGVEWKENEHYTIDDDTNQVVLLASAFSAVKAQVGDVMSAQYLRIDDDEAALQMDALLLRGASQSIADPGQLTGGGIALPDGTELGDLIIAANATMRFDGTAGTGTVVDSRMTQVGHGAWIGVATHLGPVLYSNSGAPDSRHTGAVATFVPPANYLNDVDTGPGPGGASQSIACPVPVASATILVFTEDNPNSITGSLDSYPAGYLVATDPSAGTTVCKAGILYWPPDGTLTPPSGSIVYTCHNSGLAYATTIGLQGETD